MKTASMIGATLLGAAILIAAPISLNQSPDKRSIGIAEFCGSEDRAAADPWEYCRSQQASTSPSISALRGGRDLLSLLSAGWRLSSHATYSAAEKPLAGSAATSPNFHIKRERAVVQRA